MWLNLVSHIQCSVDDGLCLVILAQVDDGLREAVLEIENGLCLNVVRLQDLQGLGDLDLGNIVLFENQVAMSKCMLDDTNKQMVGIMGLIESESERESERKRASSGMVCQAHHISCCYSAYLSLCACKGVCAHTAVINNSGNIHPCEQ
jgi:hypothetical protein